MTRNNFKPIILIFIYIRIKSIQNEYSYVFNKITIASTWKYKHNNRSKNVKLLIQRDLLEVNK